MTCLSNSVFTMFFKNKPNKIVSRFMEVVAYE